MCNAASALVPPANQSAGRVSCGQTFERITTMAIFNAGNGNDTLNGGDDNDIVNGGNGNDTR